MNVFENPWKFYRHPFKWLKYFFCSFKNFVDRFMRLNIIVTHDKILYSACKIFAFVVEKF